MKLTNPNWGWHVVQGLTVLPIALFWAVVYGLLFVGWQLGLIVGLMFALMASRLARRMVDLRTQHGFIYEPHCSEVKMVTPIELWPAASKLQADIRRFCTELGIDVPDFQVLPCCQDEPAFVGTSSKKGTVIIGQKQLKLPYDQALSIVAHELGHAASPWLHRRMHSRALFDAAKLYIGAPFVMLSRLFGKRAQRHVIIAMDRFSELLLRPARLLQAKLSRDAEYRSDAYAAAKTSVDATIEALKSGRKPRMARMRHEIHTPIGVMIIVGEGMISPREDTSPTRSHPLLKRRIAALEALRDNDKTD